MGWVGLYVHTNGEGMENSDDERKDTNEVEERERERELGICKYLSGKGVIGNCKRRDGGKKVEGGQEKEKEKKRRVTRNGRRCL